MKKLPYIFILFLGLSLTLTSCKKDEDDQDDTTTPTITKDLSLHFSALFGEDDFDYNTSYSMNGVDVQFQEIRYYLSNFEVSNTTGSSENLSTVLLVDAGLTAHIDLVSLPETFSDIENLDFMLGLDYETNHSDPTVAEAPLNDGTMHWGWNPDSGYKFIKIEGTRDLDGDGTFEPFSIHVAEDALARSISKTVNGNFENNSLMVHFMIDYKVWFEDVDFSVETLTGTHGDSELTQSIVNQFESSLIVMN